MINPVRMATNFVNGVLSAPGSIASGMAQILGTVGAGSASAAAHHSLRLTQFLQFISKATFSGGVQRMAELALREVVDGLPAEVVDHIADQFAAKGGRLVGSRAISAAAAKMVATEAASLEKAALMRSRAQSIVTMLNAAHIVAESEAAADRLERRYPQIYAALDAEGLVGGYFLIEKGVEEFLANLRR